MKVHLLKCSRIAFCWMPPPSLMFLKFHSVKDYFCYFWLLLPYTWPKKSSQGWKLTFWNYSESELILICPSPGNLLLYAHFSSSSKGFWPGGADKSVNRVGNGGFSLLITWVVAQRRMEKIDTKTLNMGWVVYGWWKEIGRIGKIGFSGECWFQRMFHNFFPGLPLINQTLTDDWSKCSELLPFGSADLRNFELMC